MVPCFSSQTVMIRQLVLPIATLPLGRALRRVPARSIIITFTDDMGFSDIDCRWNEVPTPNSGAPAADGAPFTQFSGTVQRGGTRASFMKGPCLHWEGRDRLDGKMKSKSRGLHGKPLPRCMTFADVPPDERSTEISS